MLVTAFADYHQLLQMPSSSSSTSLERRRQGYWTVALVALGMTISLGDARAALLSAPSGERGDLPHSCKCGSRCRGATCCCAPEEPKQSAPPIEVPEKVSPPESAEDVDVEGPCFAMDPCGDPAVAPGAYEGLTKTVALIWRLRSPHGEGGRRLVPSRCLRLPARFASRLERPPRAIAPA